MTFPVQAAFAVRAASLLLMLLICGVANATGTSGWDGIADTVFQNQVLDDRTPQIMALAQDGEGFLWISAGDGLDRWDGYRVRHYESDPHDPTTLQDSLITALHTDASGTLWIGTNSGGLAHRDRDHDRFVSIRAADGLSNDNVLSIADDGTTGLWIGTNGGLDHLDLRTGAIQILRHGPQAGSLPDDRVQAVLVDHAGTLWVGGAGGLARRRVGSQGFALVGFPSSSNHIAVTSLFEDAVGRLWIGTSSGAYLLGPRDAAPVPLAERATGMPILQTQEVWTFAQATPGEVWIATIDDGIVAVDTINWRMRRIRHDPINGNSLASEAVYALLKDRAGDLWAGGNQGLSRAAPTQTVALTLFAISGRTDGLAVPEIQSVLTASDGREWIGNRTGIEIIDPAKNHFTQLKTDASRPGSALPIGYTQAVVEAADHWIYMGTRKGLYRADLDGQHVEFVPIPGRDPTAGVHALLADGGTLWVGGGNDGVWALPVGHGKDDPVRHFDAGRLNDGRITTMMRDGDDLWIGTRNGLDRLDKRSGEIETILPRSADPAALSGGFIASLALDRAHRLWVATQGGGISVLVGRKDTRPIFRQIGKKAGLTSDDVDMILPWKDEIWVSTDDGIARIDPRDFSVRVLHRAEGVAISAYFGNSGSITATGELLFGGDRGLTVIRPSRWTDWTYRPSIVVTDAWSGGKPLPSGRLNRAASDAGVLVRPDANSVAIEFASLDLSAPERNRYVYRLEGYDTDWIQVGPSMRLVSYTNLSPGRYVLRVRGSNRDGIWSARPLAVPIRVLPAWYQTIWFQLGLLVAGAAAVLGMVQGRTLYLRRRQRELLRLVTERTRELEESKNQIEILAYQDALTGLPNRRMFSDTIHKLIAASQRQHGLSFALLVLDLDQFKQINDTLGHDAGDAVLIEAALRIKAAIRVPDHVARLGGDEFAILLTDLGGPLDQRAVEEVCARIVESFDAPILFKQTAITTSVSVGAALHPDHGATQTALYKSADLALYAAKRAGRKLFRVHGALDQPTIVTAVEQHQDPDADFGHREALQSA